MTDTDKLAALAKAVEAGEYERVTGSPPRYYDFGTDSEGVIPGSRMDRMGYLLGGKEACIERLAVLRAKIAEGEVMGTVIHEATLVTSWNAEMLAEPLPMVGLFSLLSEPQKEAALNFVGPDSFGPADGPKTAKDGQD